MIFYLYFFEVGVVVFRGESMVEMLVWFFFMGDSCDWEVVVLKGLYFFIF